MHYKINVDYVIIFNNNNMNAVVPTVVFFTKDMYKNKLKKTIIIM